MSRFRTFALNNFQGLNEDESPHALGDNELTIARNVWRRGRTMGTRPGTVRDPDDDYNLSIVGDLKICGIADYRRDRNTARTLVVVVADDIHTDDTTKLTKGTSVDVTNAAEELWTFTQHKGVLFAAGGDILVSDMPWFWDAGAGTQAEILSIPNLSDVDQPPRWIYQWSNYGFAGGFEDSDGSANPGTVRYSALNDLQTWPKGNSIGGFSAVGGWSTNSDEYLTGANSYQDNEGKWLMILSNRALYPVQQTGSRLSPFAITDKVANGCVSHHAYVNLGIDVGDGIYLSDQGIHSLRQSQAHGSREDAFLSFKIRDTMKTLNRAKLHEAVGAYWKEQGVVIFAVPTGSNVVNNQLLVLDVRDVASGSELNPGQDITAENARWFLWELGDDANHTPSFMLTGQRDITGNVASRWRVFLGNYKGDICEFDEDTHTDLGGGYAPTFQTKHFTFGEPFTRKQPGNILVDAQPGGKYNPTVQAIFDFGEKESRAYPLSMPIETSLWGTALFGQALWSTRRANKQTKIYVTGYGDSVAYKFTHGGVGEPFFIAQLSGEMAGMGEAGTD